mmetsp:Transcript_29832/g.84020  ORF Transcript_29832/g.84020 Transcript_29832/m.84020 type:complete len:141 (+) Transcript_29832:60-482(+)
MAKRKRHKKKADLGKLKATLTKKRGRTVVTPEVELKQTTEQINREIEHLKESKREQRLAKTRKKNQPAPVEKRKALDHAPTIAGRRTDRTIRVQQREAKQIAREARRERIAQARAKREADDGGKDIDLRQTLGDDFFSAG